MNEKKTNIEVKIASPHDREVIVQMYLKLLHFLARFEHDMLPTQKNAEWITDSIFMPAAQKGEPILIAWDDEKPVGGIFWPIHQVPYDTRWKMAYGYGTYLDETYRSQKLGTILRNSAMEILKSKGVEKLVGMVILKNEVSVKASDRYGFQPFARLDFLDIK